MTFPSPGDPITYTDVHTHGAVTISKYRLLRGISYSGCFVRTQKGQKTKSEKGKTSKRKKRTWYLDYEVLVRRGMVHASQGRISENNEVNLVEIKFVKRDKLTRGKPRTF